MVLSLLLSLGVMLSPTAGSGAWAIHTVHGTAPCVGPHARPALLPAPGQKTSPGSHGELADLADPGQKEEEPDLSRAPAGCEAAARPAPDRFEQPASVWAELTGCLNGRYRPWRVLC